MSYMFYSCSSLKSIPDISIWKTDNVNNINYIFGKCSLLKNLPDISKWNANKINNAEKIFIDCDNILIYPDISKWNININKSYISNHLLPNISNSQSNNKNDNHFLSVYKSSSISKENNSISTSNLSDSDESTSNFLWYDNNFFNKNIENNNELKSYYDNFYY